MSVIDIGSRAGEGLVWRSSGRFFFAAALHLTVKGNGIVRPIGDREILERFRQSLEVVGVANGNAGFVPFGWVGTSLEAVRLLCSSPLVGRVENWRCAP